MAEMGALIGEPVRAAILHHLSDGSRRPAGELAHLAGASRQAASAHLSRLVDGGLLSAESRGRHRFYRIASGDAAEAIEALASWVGPTPRSVAHPPEIRRARLCYDHLAGRLGVAICDALIKRDLPILASNGPNLSPAGRDWCARCGINSVPEARRPAIRLCLDWTERHYHVGGSFGADLARMMLSAGHVASGSRRRSLNVTAAGEMFLKRELQIELSRHAPT